MPLDGDPVIGFALLVDEAPLKRPSRVSNYDNILACIEANVPKRFTDC